MRIAESQVEVFLFFTLVCLKSVRCVGGFWGFFLVFFHLPKKDVLGGAKGNPDSSGTVEVESVAKM